MVCRYMCITALSIFLMAGADAQSRTDIEALRGLAPVTTLPNTQAGRAALGANYAITGGIQSGIVRQPTLLSFSEQQEQSLRDAFITGGNLAQLADGLGTTLGAAYIAQAHYKSRTEFTSLAPSVETIIRFANTATATNSNAAKFFFANETKNGSEPVSAEATAILKANGGAADPFGRAYGRPAGSPGADRYGDSRPFETEPSVTSITGTDYFNTPSNNSVYNRGPVMNLIDSPSYPSGHTTYGFTGSLVLALLIPERYQQMIVRGAEYGNDRIILGSHYAMDVLGARTLALYDMAHLLANDPAYVGATTSTSSVKGNFRDALLKARSDARTTLEAACKNTLASCARDDIGRFSDPAADEAFYASTQTYGLPTVYPQNAERVEDVAARAPEAGYLITVALPSLSLQEADRILTDTEGPGGGFLDDGSAFGVYSRLNLYLAFGQALRLVEARDVPRKAQQEPK